ncbi:hypothetical protein RHSIM_RhsimUnG0050200 [Rhododendron simsii]|uniref:Bifunctional inhibitor/plant lipid transfer protein/seed storage helical domain-containing protein n=1 Tax=Rhododendron simsii TaxID=118357 RepID=A0A834FXC7_RHOSS|nr:hypothetical protein RHSIM_RhsimUnG0050200 [Rhododendron simsii]
MGSKGINASLTLFLLLNLLFFTFVSACETCQSNPNPNPNPKPSPSPNPPTPSSATTCPIDALKFGVCVGLLDGLINVLLGTPPKAPCCSLIDHLVDLEAAVCLCTAIKANIFGIILDIPLSLTLLLNDCGKNCPPDFHCA